MSFLQEILHDPALKVDHAKAGATGVGGIAVWEITGQDVIFWLTVIVLVGQIGLMIPKYLRMWKDRRGEKKRKK
jgi:hypothetical protein